MTLLTATEEGALRRKAIKVEVDSSRGAEARVKATFVVDGYPEDFTFRLGPETGKLRDGEATVRLPLSPRQREVLDFAIKSCRGATLGDRGEGGQANRAASAPGCGGRASADARAAVNLISDLLETFPASKPALLAIDAEGGRRVWHFGELVAMSAGLSGAFAARGVGRGDVVMTLVGNRLEWVLSLLACWRMGAVALPCSTQLRRRDLELRTRGRQPDALRRRRGAAGRAPGRDRVHDPGRARRRRSTRTAPGAAGREGRPRPRGPGADRLHLRAPPASRARALHAQRYLPGQRAQAEHWLGAREGELVWCTTATGWSKSARNVFLAPWLCGAAAMLVDGRFEPAERLELIERERVDVALPGADRVPGARQARRAAAAAVGAPDGLGRRAAQPGGDRGLA